MCSSVSFSELNHSAYLTTNVANSEQNKIDLIPKQLMTNFKKKLKRIAKVLMFGITSGSPYKNY